LFKKIKELFLDSFAFAFATLGNKLVSFFLFPIYTHYLKPAPFGYWDVTNTLTLLLSYFSILGTDAALAYYYFDVKKEKEKNAYFTAAISISFLTSLFFLALFFIFKDFVIFVFYNSDKSYKDVVLYALLATVEAVVIQLMLAFARYSRRIWTFNFMSMFYWISSSLLNVLFLVSFGMGVLGIFLGQLLGGAFTLLILLLLFYQKLNFSFKKEHIFKLLSYGIPLLPSLLSFWIMNSLSRPLIANMVSPHDAGLYSAAFRLASFIFLITAGFQLAFRPFAMSIKEREDAPYIYSLLARSLLILGTFAIMFLNFFIKDIMALLTSYDYIVAYPIVWVLSLSTLFNTFYVVISVGLLIKKKTSIISKAFFYASCFYLILNFLVIPRYSFFGASIVSLLTYLFIIYYIYFKAQKIYYIPFKMTSITVYLFYYLCLMTAITLLQIYNFPFLTFFNFLAFLSLVAVLFLTRLGRLTWLHQVWKIIWKKYIS